MSKKITPSIIRLDNPREYLLAWKNPDNSLSLYSKEGQTRTNYWDILTLKGDIETIIRLYPETYTVDIATAILLEKLIKEEGDQDG